MRYLNYAGTSYPKPAPVHLAVAETLAARPQNYREIYAETHELVSREFEQGGSVAFTSGCTAALGFALGDLPWQPGDILVTSSLEHHALQRQALTLQQQRGIEFIPLKYGLDNPVDLGQFDTLLQTGRVRAIAITAASNITGQPLPIKKLAERAHAHQALLIVDAAQTFGTDLFSTLTPHADVIVTAGHKNALGPQGIGILYARNTVSFSCSGAICEIGESARRSFPGFCDLGSVNLAGAAGLAAGLKWTETQSRAHIGRKTRELAKQLREGLSERDSVFLLGPQQGSITENWLPIVSFIPRNFSLDRVAAHFENHDVLVRVGTHCAPMALASLGAEDGCVRVSFGAASEIHDAERVLEILDSI